MSCRSWKEVVRCRVTSLEPGELITAREVSDDFGASGPTPRQISCMFSKNPQLEHVGNRSSAIWRRI